MELEIEDSLHTTSEMKNQSGIPNRKLHKHSFMGFFLNIMILYGSGYIWNCNIYQFIWWTLVWIGCLLMIISPKVPYYISIRLLEGLNCKTHRKKCIKKHFSILILKLQLGRFLSIKIQMAFRKCWHIWKAFQENESQSIIFFKWSNHKSCFLSI